MAIFLIYKMAMVIVSKRGLNKFLDVTYIENCLACADTEC